MVAFRFEVAGEVWEVVRALRRKGQSQHALSRLAADSADPDVVEKVMLEAEVNAKVVELLGLEFDAFSKSVLLAQGRFSEFLRSRPGERDSVLKGVFGHDRIDAMRTAARDRVAALTARIETLQTKLEHVERLGSEVAQRTDEMKIIEDRIEVMRKAEQKHTDLTERIANAEEATKRLQHRGKQLGGLGGQLPEMTHVAHTVDAAVEAAKHRNLLAEELAGAQRGLTAAEEAVTRLHEAGTQDTLDRSLALLATREPLERRYGELEIRVAGLEKRASGAAGSVAGHMEAIVWGERRLAEAAAQVESARERVERAEEALHSARHADMAATLRVGLADGAICPVCEQHIATAPPSDEQPVTTSLEADLEAARGNAAASLDAATKTAAELEASRAALAAAARSAEAAGEDVEAATAAVAAATAELEGTGSELTVLLGAGDPGVLAADLRTKLNSAAEAAADSRKTVERIRREHDEAIRRQQDVAKELSVIGLAVVDLAARLDMAAPPVDDEDPMTVVAAVTALWEAVEAERSGVAAALARAVADFAEATTALDDLKSELGIERDFAAALAREEARVEWLGAEIGSARSEIAAAGETVEERDRAVASRELFERLAADLTDTRFVRFLLDDERARLADLGSEHFQRMSAGRYRFTDDGKFNVVDLTAADAVRKAESLSGGETFLASLGLALALAEMVSRSGGRLEAFFLDEGFGMLDSEHLDLAMEGIEMLTSGESRLVVVVSHVPELRHRLEDIIELDKSPVTGDTRVLSA